MPLFDVMIIGDYMIQRHEDSHGVILAWQTVPVIRVTGGADEVRRFGSEFAAKVFAGYSPQIQVLGEVNRIAGFVVEKVLLEGTTVPQYRARDTAPGGREDIYPTLSQARVAIGCDRVG